MTMNGFNTVTPRNTKNAPNSIGPYSQTVAFSHYNNLSAQLPLDASNGKLVEGGINEQAKQCFNNIKEVLRSIGHNMDDIIKVTLFLKNIADLDAVTDVYRQYFSTYMPTLTAVAIADLPMDAKVQVEALVSNGEGTIPGAPQPGDLIKVAKDTAAAPLSEFSTQTVAFSHYNNISAQLPIDPLTGKIIAGDIHAQTVQCLNNIKAILGSIDVPFDDIVKINIFLIDLADMDVVNKVYTTFFPDSAIARAVAYFPARTIIPATALPLGARVQIEAIVSHGDGTPPQEVEDRHNIVIKANNTNNAPRCALSSQAVAFSHYNHLSAQMPIDPTTGNLVEGGIEAQTNQCLKNIKAIVESIGHSLADVVRVNIFLKNIVDIASVDHVYVDFFPDGIPARRTIGVAALPGDALIQIDVVLSNAEGTAPADK